ncbi:MAG: CDP-alcohol phosphatidyltransferase family protein [Proteobacteria bacterium]|nr:CDP-alcohol phosphatidyltransferase family protein [Pseudomonadota bacterium]
MTDPTPATIWRHLPNALTVLRMALVVPLAWLIREMRYDEAVVVAAIAGLSDALDGFLAKHCGWQSWLGGVLDPIADKLMLVACFVTLGMVGAHPDWLTWLVVGRDAVIVAGAVAWHNLIGRIHAQPTRLSKLTTVVQITYVLAQLLHLSRWFDLPPRLLDGLIWLTAALTIISGLQYVAVWTRKALRVRGAGA